MDGWSVLEDAGGWVGGLHSGGRGYGTGVVLGCEEPGGGAWNRDSVAGEDMVEGGHSALRWGSVGRGAAMGEGRSFIRRKGPG